MWLIAPTLPNLNMEAGSTNGMTRGRKAPFLYVALEAPRKGLFLSAGPDVADRSSDRVPWSRRGHGERPSPSRAVLLDGAAPGNTPEPLPNCHQLVP